MTSDRIRRIPTGGLLVAGILVAALAVRLAYVLVVVGDDAAAGDAIYYSAQADVLARGGGFEHPFTGEAAADHPPMTAILLALPALGDGDPLFRQRLFMAVLGTGAVAMIGLLGAAIAGRRAGLGAAALATVHPGLWINDGLAMSETPTAVVTAAVGVAVLRWRRSGDHAWVVGLAGGLAVLTRAELALLVLLLSVVPPTGRALRDHGRDLLAIGAVAALVLAPWTARNLLRFEEPVLVSTNDGLTLLGSNCDRSYGDGLGFWHLQCAPDVPGDQSEVSAIYREMALDYVGAHRDELPRVVAARLGRTWSVWRPYDMVFLNQGEGRPKTASRLAIWSWWLLVPMAAGGLWRHRRDRDVVILAVAPVVTVTAVTILTYGIPRFRLPAEVILVAIAGAALSRRRDRSGA